MEVLGEDEVAEDNSLFSGEWMRNTPKTKLRKFILQLHGPETIVDINEYVIDGGPLVHKYKQLKSKVDGEKYVDTLIDKQYDGKNITFVFDGYSATNSTKDHEQRRRYETATKKDDDPCWGINFKSDKSRKEEIKAMLSKKFEEKGFSVYCAESDADTSLVNMTLEKSIHKKVAVVTEDVDILVLLCHHCNAANMRRKTIYFQCKQQNIQKTWEIGNIVKQLNKSPSAKNLLFAHAWSGCDTTSATYGEGKNKVLENLKDRNIQKLADKFGQTEVSQDEIAKAGEEIMLASFGAPGSISSLDGLRRSRYKEMLKSPSVVDFKKLPPTTKDYRYHSYRVHLQVCQWKKLNLNVLKAENWGWIKSDGSLIPQRNNKRTHTGSQENKKKNGAKRHKRDSESNRTKPCEKGEPSSQLSETGIEDPVSMETC